MKTLTATGSDFCPQSAAAAQPGPPRRVAFATLGCKVNLSDTDAVACMFRDRGYQIVEFTDEADVYVINTCSVTNTGASKSRQVIRRAIRRNPGAIVVVMGCYAQYAPDEVAHIDGVDIVIGTHRRTELVDLVEAAQAEQQPLVAVDKIMTVREFEEMPAQSFDGRTRAILKVQDGCNEFCSYCQIPWARGRNRSRRLDRVKEQAEALAQKGFKEIVLTGVHLGTYGEDLDPPTTLAQLVRTVGQTPGIERVRISSVDPHEVTPELVETIGTVPTVCRHLHIPAQSGEDGILLAMRRRNTAEEYLQLVESLRAALPGVAITTDIIVGFPGESEASFAETMRFCAACGFSKIHVFPYSRRKGTRADKMPGHLPNEVKQARAQALIALSDELALAYHRSLIGKEVVVLVEGASDQGPGMVQGLTDTYVRVHLPAEKGEPGTLVAVQPTVAFAHGVLAG